MGNRVYHPVFRAVRLIGKQGKLVGIGIVVSVFFQQDIQPVVPPLDKVAGGKTPLRKHDGAAVGLLHCQRITAQDVFLQDIPYSLPALRVGCGFYNGGIRDLNTARILLLVSFAYHSFMMFRNGVKSLSVGLALSTLLLIAMNRTPLEGN